MKHHQRAIGSRIGVSLLVTALLAGCTGIARLSPEPTPTSERMLAIVDQQQPVETPTQIVPVEVAPAVIAPKRVFLPVVSHSVAPVPVEGGHTFPAPTMSYYMMTIDPSANFNLGCDLGLKDLNTSGAQDNLVVLDYGSPKQKNGVYGASLLLLSGFGSVDQIATAAENFGWGYYVCTGEDTQSHLRLVIGTTNYPTVYNPSVTYEHGMAWGNMVNRVNTWLAEQTTNSIMQQVDAVGGNDLELTWNSYTNSRAWLDGYDAVNGYALYNFGALPGCPTLSNPGAQCGGYDTYLWSKEQVWYVIYGAGPVYPLPEIYARNGVNAEQWYLFSVYGYEAHGAPVKFVGSLTTYVACLQEGGCGSGNSAINNTPEQGWTQLYNLLNGDARTAQGLRWATDIAWTLTSGVVEPYSLSSTLAAVPGDMTAQQKDQYQQQAIAASLQNPDLDESARLSLEEKLAMASRVTENIAPASKERPLQLMQAATVLPDIDLADTLVDGSEGLIPPSQAQIANVWGGMVGDAYTQVLAGALSFSPDQGVLFVIAARPDGAALERQAFYAPSYTGQLRILERQGEHLVIAAANGQVFQFDLTTHELH